MQDCRKIRSQNCDSLQYDALLSAGWSKQWLICATVQSEPTV